MGGELLTSDADRASSREASADRNVGRQGPIGGHESTLYGDLVWLGAGLAVIAGAFVLTRSAAVQGLSMLAYSVVGALIVGRQYVGRAGAGPRRGYRWRRIVCLLVAGLGVYLVTQYGVRIAFGPWSPWWLTMSLGVVIFRQWERQGAS